MSATIDRGVEALKEPIYFVFRVTVGLLFMQHGARKLFGLFGGVDGSGGTAPLVGLYGAAGVIEFIGGFLIAVGLLTRLVAMITAGEMIIAQLLVHIPEGLIPIQNGGELSLLYLATFLIISVYGPGRYSIEHLVFNRGSVNTSTTVHDSS